MIFITINKKIDTKKALDKSYMFLFFKKNKSKFLNTKQKIIDLNIHLIRNFRGKFRNMSLLYEIVTSKQIVKIRAKIHKHQNTPYREYMALKWFGKHGLKDRVPIPMHYYKFLNMFFYLQAPGDSLENLLSQNKFDAHESSVHFIAKYLKAFHNISQKPAFVPVETIKNEIKQRKHWFFLIRKCSPDFYPYFSNLLKKLWDIKKKNKHVFLSQNDFSLVHDDFHWGNIIFDNTNNKQDKVPQFRFIDFAYSTLSDRLKDVGGFLAQNDSMFRYYAPKHIDIGNGLRQKFLKSYFNNKISDKEQMRIIYFEAQKMLEMAAIIGFMEPNKKSKTTGMIKLFEQTENRLDELNQVF